MGRNEDRKSGGGAESEEEEEVPKSKKALPKPKGKGKDESSEEEVTTKTKKQQKQKGKKRRISIPFFEEIPDLAACSGSLGGSERLGTWDGLREINVQSVPMQKH